MRINEGADTGTISAEPTKADGSTIALYTPDGWCFELDDLHRLALVCCGKLAGRGSEAMADPQRDADLSALSALKRISKRRSGRNSV